jgi:hypothetical protein
VRRTHGNVPFARCTYKAQRNGYCAQHQGQETRQAFLQALLRPDWEEVQAQAARKLLGESVDPKPVQYQTEEEHAESIAARATRRAAAVEKAKKATEKVAEVKATKRRDSELSSLLPSREEAQSALADLRKEWGLG